MSDFKQGSFISHDRTESTHPGKKIIWFCILFVLTISILDVAGWITGISWLKSILPSGTPMRLITGVSLLLASLSFIVILIQKPAALRIIMPFSSGIFLILTSLVSIYSWSYSDLTGRESVLVTDPHLAFLLSITNRGPMLSEITILLIGIVLILLTSGKKSRAGAAHIIFIPGVVTSYLVPLSYLLSIPSTSPFFDIPVSLNAGLAFCAMSLAIYLIKPRTWLMKVFTSRGPGGIIGRTLLPWLLLFPVFIGWLLIYGVQSEIFVSETGVLLAALTFTVCFVILIWFTARSVDSIDIKRQLADKALKRSYEELEERVRSRTSELIETNKKLDLEIVERKKAEAGLFALNESLEQRVSERTSELLQANERLHILSQTSSLLLASKKPRELMNSLCLHVMEFLDCQVFFNYLVDETRGKLHLNSYGGISGKTAGTIEWLDIGSAVCGCVAQEGSRIIAENVQEIEDPRTAMVRSFGVRAYACHPILSPDKVIGTLSFGSKSRDRFSEDDLSLMKAVTDQIAIAIARKKNEESIISSETRYRNLMELSPGASFVIRQDHIVLLNSAAKNLLGVSMVDEILGKPVLSIFHPGSHKNIRSRIEKTAKGGTFPMTEEQIIRIDGGILDVEVVSSAITGYEEPALQMIMNDITQRKRAEKELYDTKNYLENLIDYANAPIIVWDRENKIRLFNHAFEHLTGYAATEVEGKKLEILFPKDSLKESVKQIRHALTENWVTIEMPILTKNNEIRIVLWNSSKIYDKNRKTYSIMAQGNDITERIKAERAFKESKEKLDIALENGNIGIWEWEIGTNNFRWDARMGRMLGVEAGEGESSLETFESAIHEEDLAHMRNAFNQALKEDVPLDTIYRIRHKNDGINYISTKAVVEKDRQGQPVKMSGVSFDITDMKKGAEKVLFNLTEDLLRSNKELEQFAYVASHDLQEPLRMVSSFTQLLALRYKDKLDNDANEFIQFAVDGAARMQILINDLLNYSRIGTQGKKFTLIDMQYVLNQAINNLSFKIKEKQAEVTYDSLPSVVADIGQMIHLVQNLISNALKFCKRVPRIHISATEEDDRYVFSVKDNGIGIEEQYYGRIFQIFQRLHLKDEYGGTGIGLAICKRIAERHGGKIWVASKPGKGSVFYFSVLKRQILPNHEELNA
ncbi:MAG: PAS domain S-box protein [Bacteroidales bacterium]